MHQLVSEAPAPIWGTTTIPSRTNMFFKFLKRHAIGRRWMANAAYRKSKHLRHAQPARPDDRRQLDHPPGAIHETLARSTVLPGPSGTPQLVATPKKELNTTYTTLSRSQVDIRTDLRKDCWTMPKLRWTAPLTQTTKLSPDTAPVYRQDLQAFTRSPESPRGHLQGRRQNR